ncbi:MAG: hypothetical protein LBJ00_07780 [Planctomycetaceae bacterium]|jgi:hypothetical protein|nr:hypothetical protein [Planctomycetaceae bacterium]
MKTEIRITLILFVLTSLTATSFLPFCFADEKAEEKVVEKYLLKIADKATDQPQNIILSKDLPTRVWGYLPDGVWEYLPDGEELREIKGNTETTTILRNDKNNPNERFDRFGGTDSERVRRSTRTTTSVSAAPFVPATPAVPAVPFVPATPAVPAVPVVPATPAVPAIPVIPNATVSAVKSPLVAAKFVVKSPEGFTQYFVDSKGRRGIVAEFDGSYNLANNINIKFKNGNSVKLPIGAEIMVSPIIRRLPMPRVKAELPVTIDLLNGNFSDGLIDVSPDANILNVDWGNMRITVTSDNPNLFSEKNITQIELNLIHSKKAKAGAQTPFLTDEEYLLLDQNGTRRFFVVPHDPETDLIVREHDGSFNFCGLNVKFKNANGSTWVAPVGTEFVVRRSSVVESRDISGKDNPIFSEHSPIHFPVTLDLSGDLVRDGIGFFRNFEGITLNIVDKIIITIRYADGTPFMTPVGAELELNRIVSDFINEEYKSLIRKGTKKFFVVPHDPKTEFIARGADGSFNIYGLNIRFKNTNGSTWLAPVGTEFFVSRDTSGEHNPNPNAKIDFPAILDLFGETMHNVIDLEYNGEGIAVYIGGLKIVIRYASGHPFKVPVGTKIELNNYVTEGAQPKRKPRAKIIPEPKTYPQAKAEPQTKKIPQLKTELQPKTEKIWRSYKLGEMGEIKERNGGVFFHSFIKEMKVSEPHQLVYFTFDGNVDNGRSYASNEKRKYDKFILFHVTEEDHKVIRKSIDEINAALRPVISSPPAEVLRSIETPQPKVNVQNPPTEVSQPIEIPQPKAAPRPKIENILRSYQLGEMGEFLVRDSGTFLQFFHDHLRMSGIAEPKKLAYFFSNGNMDNFGGNGMGYGGYSGGGVYAKEIYAKENRKRERFLLFYTNEENHKIIRKSIDEINAALRPLISSPPANTKKKETKQPTNSVEDFSQSMPAANPFRVAGKSEDYQLLTVPAPANNPTHPSPVTPETPTNINYSFDAPMGGMGGYDPVPSDGIYVADMECRSYPIGKIVSPLDEDEIREDILEIFRVACNVNGISHDNVWLRLVVSEKHAVIFVYAESYVHKMIPLILDKIKDINPLLHPTSTIIPTPPNSSNTIPPHISAVDSNQIRNLTAPFSNNTIDAPIQNVTPNVTPEKVITIEAESQPKENEKPL